MGERMTEQGAVPLGYKQTEIGVIPEDWEVQSISSFCSTYSGGTPNTSQSEFYGGSIPWITSGDLNKRRIKDVAGCITQKGFDSSAAQMVNQGDIIIALYGATAGVVAITEIFAAINQAVLAIIPQKCDNEYLFHHLSHRKDRIVSTYTQGGQPNLSGDIIRSLVIPLPKYEEQHAIAAALSDVDGLIGALDALISKKRDLKQAAMQQLLTGRTRLPGFGGEWELSDDDLMDGAHSATYRVPPGYKRTEIGVIPEDWEQLPIDKICTLHNGRAYALHEWETMGVPVIRLQNLTGGLDYYYSNFKLSEDKYCVHGDLLYMWSATFGPYIWKGDKAIYHYHIWKVAPHNKITDRLFLYYKLGEITEGMKKRASNGGTMLHITKESMESTLLIFPPLSEQTAIATVLSDMDAEIAALECRRDKVRDIKQGMMQQLLTGKVRLVSREEMGEQNNMVQA